MSNFNKRVYALVKLIPPGHVLSYSAVARLLGVPHGARAVGWALHALPEKSDVPWQRVVNAQGRISTRCESYSEDRQRELLQAEGVLFDRTDLLKLRHFNAIMWRITPEEVDLLLADILPSGQP
jgi:methylated-DNA-protein-cysteine methyltransferase-like protein